MADVELDSFNGIVPGTVVRMTEMQAERLVRIGGVSKEYVERRYRQPRKVKVIWTNTAREWESLECDGYVYMAPDEVEIVAAESAVSP